MEVKRLLRNEFQNGDSKCGAQLGLVRARSWWIIAGIFIRGSHSYRRADLEHALTWTVKEALCGGNNFLVIARDIVSGGFICWKENPVHPDGVSPSMARRLGGRAWQAHAPQQQVENLLMKGNLQVGSEMSNRGATGVVSFLIHERKVIRTCYYECLLSKV